MHVEGGGELVNVLDECVNEQEQIRKARNGNEGDLLLEQPHPPSHSRVRQQKSKTAITVSLKAGIRVAR